ncbi:hypothetical protein A3I48_03415 [Candidatus Daviesbacteria bacterium RIFCSPLOWO2_02_FULL_36_7]|uniref:Membrane protein insertion efficiency factor YidD n=1 Tax=Candidatus Daviesbacteria bacterium RIFCSPLOWO2_02_FULL_36_7 TaxID=1797792 RepID=A0A1F5MGH7_9BACT|nr:MAG: hypothetical protein A3I48_03415 [Candidatus Daviesbacteria bacterium RIFCSPLOWO2_02_FULL_36_7]
MIKIINFIISFYQAYFSFDRGILALFAPGGACRYNPSCSEYAKRMIREFGVLQGVWLGIKRIWKCR